MLFSGAYLSDTHLGHVCVPTAARLGRSASLSRVGLLSTVRLPRSGSVSPTTCVTLRWSTAILQDYILSRASNLLWLAWPNFGSKGTFPPTLGFTDYTLEEKKMFLKGFLLFPFLRKFREFNNCWPLANTQTKVFFQLRLHLDPSCQIFQAVYL